MEKFVFIHKTLGYKFKIDALRYYHAVEQLERILGAEKYWVHDYICLSNGQQVGYKAA